MAITVSIGIIGDFNSKFLPHVATDSAINHAAVSLNLHADIQWLATDSLEQNDSALSRFDALWCAPGGPYKSMVGALNAIRYARENDVPFIGTCGGFQHVVLEYARNVLGYEDAAHAEYDPFASNLFVSALSCSLVGRTMTVHIQADSKVHGWYGQQQVSEQYYCNFGLNPEYQPLFNSGDLITVGTDSDGEVRILEMPSRRFYVATLFVPQLPSTVENPHPLIVNLLKAAYEFSTSRQSERAAS